MIHFRSSHARSRLPSRGSLALLRFVLLALPGFASADDARAYRPWVIESSEAVRPAAPDPSQEADDAAAVRDALAGLDEGERAEALFWDAGAANHRWVNALLEHYRVGPPSPLKGRGLAMLNVAVYDAVVAADAAQRHFARPRPDVTAILAANGPHGYPSVRAAAAGAAAGVLAHLLPDEAAAFEAQAASAARSRVDAGVSFPSDVDAGLTLGRAVAERVLARVEDDGSDLEWQGSRPEGPGKLKGETFVHAAVGDWKPWVIDSPKAFLPDPPLAIDSDEMAAQLADLKAIERTVPAAILAWSQHSVDSAYQVWYDRLAMSVFESGLDRDLPRAAFVYAAFATANNDAMIACFGAKYTWWMIRPAQLDESLDTLFPSPPHPSYPSAHSCSGSTNARTLTHFFPGQAESLAAMADAGGHSRLVAGIHYPMDKVAGEKLGNAVADSVLQTLERRLLGEGG